MTPGILALIAACTLVVGFLIVILNFIAVANDYDLGTKNIVLHIVGAVICSLSMLTLIFSGLWFLVTQIGKGA